jgi:hypothetical protein
MATPYNSDHSITPNEEETVDVVDDLMEQEDLNPENYDCVQFRGKVYVAEVDERRDDIRGSGEQVQITSYNTDEVYILDPTAGVNNEPVLREAVESELDPLK